MGNPSQYAGVVQIFRRYWHTYGGWPALVGSPYLMVSLVLTLVAADYWLTYEWWDQALAVLPSVLGFTLGGFAILISFGDDKFKALIAGRDPEDGGQRSPFMGVSATFMHFVLLQVAGIVWALMSAALHFDPPAWLAWAADSLRLAGRLADGMGYWLFLYSLCSALAAGFAIFRMAFLFDLDQTSRRESAHTAP
jgi:hypothetical protein